MYIYGNKHYYYYYTHYLTICFENVIFYFYAVGGKNNYKSYGSVFVHILQ